MIPVVLAGVLVVGAASVLGLGGMRVFRQRRMSIVDYPELPAPSPEELSGDQAQTA